MGKLLDSFGVTELESLAFAMSVDYPDVIEKTKPLIGSYILRDIESLNEFLYEIPRLPTFEKFNNMQVDPLRGILMYWGIGYPEAYEITNSWKTNIAHSDWEHSVVPNVLKAYQLETQQIGTVANLFYNYGINQFIRYGLETLGNQAVDRFEGGDSLLFLSSWYDLPRTSEYNDRRMNYGSLPISQNKTGGPKVLFAEFDQNGERFLRTMGNIRGKYGHLNNLIWNFHSGDGQMLSGYRWELEGEEWKFNWEYVDDQIILQVMIPVVMELADQIILSTCEATRFVEKFMNGIPGVIYSEGMLSDIYVNGTTILPHYVHIDDAMKVTGDAECYLTG